MTKKVTQSKTVIVNVLALIAIIIQSQTGTVVNVETQAAIITLVNIALRFITKESIMLAT
jgi:hypothetical protein